MSTTSSPPGRFARLLPAIVCALAVAPLAGCPGKERTGTAEAAVAPSTPRSVAKKDSPDGLDRCALLNDAEIDAAIGAHSAGRADITNEWGLQSCRWTSTQRPRGGDAPNRERDAVELTVFFKERESWARGQATGDAVRGVVPGAVYDPAYGALWFNCGTRFCVVTTSTARAEKREQIARRLAELAATRLR